MNDYHEKLNRLKGVRIDVRKLKYDILKHKKLYLFSIIFTFIFSAIYSMGLYDYYTCTIKLLPEHSSSNASSIVNLKRLLGFSPDMIYREDALYPITYPVFMKSPEFIASIFNIRVKSSTDGKQTTYYEYLLSEYSKSKWEDMLNVFYYESDVDKIECRKDTINPFRLSTTQNKIEELVLEKVEIIVDPNNFHITLSVTDNNPVIAAIMVDSLRVKMQEFITNYRINKTKSDLDYYNKMCLQAKLRYEQASKECARFKDSHMNIQAEKTKQQLARLEEERQLMFNTYSALLSYVTILDAEAQYMAPAFFTLKKPTVPLYKSGPKRSRVCLSILLKVLLLITGCVFVREGDFYMLIGIK